MNRKDDINELLARHFANEKMTERQEAELKQWIAGNAEEYQKLRLLIDRPIKTPDEKSYDVEKAWLKIEPALSHRRTINRPVRKTWMFAAAASLLIIVLFSIPYLVGNKDKDVAYYANNEASEMQIMLSDGSEVHLYPHSTLEFSHPDDHAPRNAILKGKAFFKVKRHNEVSFIVKTEAIDVEVLGTSFLVDASTPASSGVYVKTGTVKVTCGKQSVIINKDEKAILQDGTIKTGMTTTPETDTADNSLTLDFNNAKITDVVKEIEEKTGIRIELSDGLENNFVTTRIETIDALNITKELAFLCGCKYKILKEGKHYVLYK